MPEIITISDTFKVDISEVSKIGEIRDFYKNKPMLSFILVFKNDSFRNICFHYDQNNKIIISQKAMSLHRKIESYLEKRDRLGIKPN